MMTHELEKIMSLIEERLCIIWYPTENRDTFASELAAILSRTPSHGRVSDSEDGRLPDGTGLPMNGAAKASPPSVGIPNAWHPIATAPERGHFLAWNSIDSICQFWAAETYWLYMRLNNLPGWLADEAAACTHWMPQPDAPEKTA